MTQNLSKPKPSNRYYKVPVSVTLGTARYNPPSQPSDARNELFFTQMTGNRSKLRRMSSSIHHSRKLVFLRAIVHRVAIFQFPILIPKVYIVIRIRPS